MLRLREQQTYELGWSIRWVAGFVCLLMVVAGAISAYSADRADPRDGRISTLHARLGDALAMAAEPPAATGERYASKSASEVENDLEDAASALPPAPGGPSKPRIVRNNASRRLRARLTTLAGDSLAPRAPPRA